MKIKHKKLIINSFCIFQQTLIKLHRLNKPFSCMFINSLNPARKTLNFGFPVVVHDSVFYSYFLNFTF